MARKHKHEEHENHERWLVSYADFMTLLFAFFVVLYSVSKVDNKKVQQAAQSIKWAMHMEGKGGTDAIGKPMFEIPTSGGGCATNVGAGTSANQIKQIEAIKKKLEQKLKPFVVDNRGGRGITLLQENGKLTVRLAATRFFDPGQAALKPEALPVLDAIGVELAALGRPVRVEAHTDEAPPGGGRFHNNWDLSAARAATVTTLLEDGHNIPASNLTAAGLGSAHPLATGNTAEVHELNRRVEMVVDVLGIDASAAALKAAAGHSVDTLKKESGGAGAQSPKH